MTGFAYPEMMVDVWKAYAAGQVERAHDLFDAYLPLARYEQQPGLGLAIRKYTLAKRGAIASATLRKVPEDQALRTAALRAVARARVQLASDLMHLRERFREEAAALDLAEFSIHLPQLHYEQQQWRLETYASQGPNARKD